MSERGTRPMCTRTSVAIYTVMWAAEIVTVKSVKNSCPAFMAYLFMNNRAAAVVVKTSTELFFYPALPDSNASLTTSPRSDHRLYINNEYSISR